MLVLQNWSGRLGNNIAQLVNIIDIAIYFNHNVTFKKKHYFFNVLVIQNYFSKNNNNEILTWDFFWDIRAQIPKEILDENTEKRNKILKDAFLINNINKLSENDLVIHIRSGDIFSQYPHSTYVPPPLAYYTKEINKHKYDKIYIVCEDNINPVVNKLLHLYKNSIYKKNNLEEDVKLLLEATNIIYSVGTLVPNLMLLSNNIKYIYGEAFNNKELQDYYLSMKPWRNTKIQRDYIINYNYN